MVPSRLRLLIKTTLDKHDLPHNPSVIELMVGTAAHESHLGKWRKQVDGPALGIFQMEPSTIKDIINNYLIYMPHLVHYSVLDTSDFVDNIELQIIYCRLHYMRAPGRIPNTLQRQAEYYKRHYNTYLGKATVESYIDNYVRLIKGEE